MQTHHHEPLPLVYLDDQIACVERDLQFRERLLATTGGKSAAKMTQELTCMRAVLQTLKRSAALDEDSRP